MDGTTEMNLGVCAYVRLKLDLIEWLKNIRAQTDIQ